ncbi:hypothetical protein JL722_9103 [Aureococcus anophagefferens]|nr:hypothetical protein JL722_9103 [Aureococcus anophagefferens]
MIGAYCHIIGCLVLMTISGGISGLLDARDARNEVLGAVSTMPSFERPAERAAKDDFGSASIAGGGSGAPAGARARGGGTAARRRLSDWDYEPAPIADSTAFCVLDNTTMCWGNYHYFVEVLANGPFDGIDVVGSSVPALVDLDDDGDLDLVVGDNGGVLNYYENVGSAASPSYEARTGTDNPFDGIDVGSNSKPAFADVDGDGDLDLVVGAGEIDNNLNYYENDGSAASPSYEAVTGAANPFDGISVGYEEAPALADVDGDGDLDLVAGEYEGTLDYYENVGSAASPSYEKKTGSANPFDGVDVGSASAPAFVDFDGDGDLDLVVGENDGVLYYYENVGSATSPSYEAANGAASPFDGIDVGDSSAPALVDVDGDGDLDLVVGENDGTLYYYENVGTAASPSYEAVTGAANPFDGIDLGEWSWLAPALGDVDGDGDLDLVVGLYNLYYYENVGSAASPSYAAVTGSASPFDGINVGLRSAPALVDLDGDGDLDLVVGETDGTLDYYENVGSAASPSYEKKTGTANPFDGIDVGDYSKPALVDLDGDGDLDLVVGETDGALYYYENVGSAASPSYTAVTGSASPFDGIDVGTVDSWGYRRGSSKPALGDLDGDGDLDLVVGEYWGVLFYYENVGSAASPTFAAVTGSASPFDGIDVGGSSAPALVDVDGDGDLDLVVGNEDGVLNFFANGYCTQGDTACGSNGLCDLTSVGFSEAYCQCLGGYTGDQCRECQTGYFGSTCDLCPEGGDEDRDAPRLTDTCGIAGSGRSRGSCDDGVAGSGNCTCYDIFSGSGCTEGTCPAGTIETAAFEGYFNVAECTSCDAGTYSAEGADQCTNCDAGTFSGAGASECESCAPGTYSGSGASECEPCSASTYAPDEGSGVCALADAGFHVPIEGASKQIPCLPGTSSGSGASECEPCAEGTYSSLPGQASCKQCPPFSTTLAEGATGCYSCLEDYYFSPFAVDLDDGDPSRATTRSSSS